MNRQSPANASSGDLQLRSSMGLPKSYLLARPTPNHTMTYIRRQKALEISISHGRKFRHIWVNGLFSFIRPNDAKIDANRSYGRRQQGAHISERVGIIPPWSRRLSAQRVNAFNGKSEPLMPEPELEPWDTCVVISESVLDQELRNRNSSSGFFL